MAKNLQSLWRNESGATAIEYSLIAGMIGLVIITAVTSLGIEIQGPFYDAASGLKGRR